MCVCVYVCAVCVCGCTFINYCLANYNEFVHNSTLSYPSLPDMQGRRLKPGPAPSKCLAALTLAVDWALLSAERLGKGNAMPTTTPSPLSQPGGDVATGSAGERARGGDVGDGSYRPAGPLLEFSTGTNSTEPRSREQLAMDVLSVACPLFDAIVHAMQINEAGAGAASARSSFNATFGGTWWDPGSDHHRAAVAVEVLAKRGIEHSDAAAMSGRGSGRGRGLSDADRVNLVDSPRFIRLVAAASEALTLMIESPTGGGGPNGAVATAEQTERKKRTDGHVGWLITEVVTGLTKQTPLRRRMLGNTGGDDDHAGRGATGGRGGGGRGAAALPASASAAALDAATSAALERSGSEVLERFSEVAAPPSGGLQVR